MKCTFETSAGVQSLEGVSGCKGLLQFASKFSGSKLQRQSVGLVHEQAFQPHARQEGLHKKAFAVLRGTDEGCCVFLRWA